MEKASSLALKGLIWAPEVIQAESMHFVCHWAVTVDAIGQKSICLRRCTVSISEALYAQEFSTSDALGQGSSHYSHHMVQKA